MSASLQASTMPGGNAADPMGVSIFPNGSLSAANMAAGGAGAGPQNQTAEEEETKTGGANSSTTGTGQTIQPLNRVGKRATGHPTHGFGTFKDGQGPSS